MKHFTSDTPSNILEGREGQRRVPFTNEPNSNGQWTMDNNWADFIVGSISISG